MCIILSEIFLNFINLLRGGLILSIGEELRKVREEQGLTLKEVQEKIKIRTKYLEAIENEEFDKIPGEAYAKAFIKGYANILGLDGNQFSNLYQQFIEKRKTIESQEDIVEKKDDHIRNILHNKFFPIAIMIILLILIVFAIYNVFLLNTQKSISVVDESYQSVLINNKNKTENSVIEQAIENSIADTEIEDINNIREDREINVPVKNDFIEKDLLNTGNQSKNITQNLNKKEKHIFSIVISEKTWVRVITDGNIVYEGTLNMGQVKEFVVQDKIELKIGNAAGVKLKKDGEILGPWGDRGEVINKIISF